MKIVARQKDGFACANGNPIAMGLQTQFEAALDHLTDACQLGFVEYWAAVSGEALPKTTVDAQSQFHSLPPVTLILSMLVACHVTRPRNSLYQLTSYAGRLRSGV